MAGDACPSAPDHRKRLSLQASNRVERARHVNRSMTAKPPLTLLIAAPRGFCAGVDRAIRIVELALERYGAPVYVRHEIVHNKFVVDSLKAKGAVFVPELDEVPDGVPVVFSAHGVPKAVPAKARGARPQLSRRDLPARLQGPPPGRAADRARPPHPLRRPCRPSRGDRHVRPGAGGADDPDRDRRRRRDDRARRSGQPRLPHPDHLSVDDTAEIVAILQPPLPGDPGAAQRGHLLRDLEPAGGGQGDRRRAATRCW